ncbi:polymorphic toxin-type HINT domain-containing protein [Saccharothrix sp. BKS2]|uniref:polymorphic toxin-type HINT domain-containing protein n=1 Tax=Saccharothrix sp. BKS2 TaxID=3064400 RepID=UPI0039EC12C3
MVDRFRKTAPAGSCHSFVAATLVLMADGSTQPISEVEIGDEVKATDPETGETTDREVVATIVHDDEGDMTRLTVTGEDGATGSADATSWHPVWVEAESRFVSIGDLKSGQALTSVDGTSPRVAQVQRSWRVEPVYDLTVAGVHTYYVLAGATSVLVHNSNACPRVFAVDSAGVANELPVHEIDSNAFPGVAANFAKAVGNGKSPIVTRLAGRSSIRANRNAAQAGSPRPGTLGSGMSWEEFPFASTVEGGSGATLSLIPLTENTTHGRKSLWPFLRDNDVKGGDQYYVRGR